MRMPSARSRFCMQVQKLQQAIFGIGLAQKIGGSQFQRMLAVLVGCARGDHDDRQIVESFIVANVAQQVESIHLRHFDV